MLNAARLLIIATLLLAGLVDAGAAFTKNRVGNFFDPAPVLTTRQSLQVVYTPLENWSLYDDPASGSTLWTSFDPAGLFLKGSADMQQLSEVAKQMAPAAPAAAGGTLAFGGAATGAVVTGELSRLNRIANPGAYESQYGNIGGVTGNGEPQRGTALPADTTLEQQQQHEQDRGRNPAAADTNLNNSAAENSPGGESAKTNSDKNAPKTPEPNSKGRTGNPALRDDPYSPETVSRRQSETRRQLGGEPDPDTPIPDQPPGQNLKGTHTSGGKTAHQGGERNVNPKEEHSRVAKGAGGRGAKKK